MIEIHNLKQQGHFNRFRVDIPKLQINEPGILALVGHNGAGKSTLLSLIAGLQQPFSGCVLFEGKNTFENFEKLKEQIHIMSWGISFFPNMSCRDHLKLTKHLSSTWNFSLENELVKDFYLPMGKKLETLSRGEQAKLKLLLSLPRMPRVVLCDEVTNELDTDSRRTIFKKLDSYSFENNAKVIVATNMVDDIERYATSVILLRNGQIVLSGNLDAIKEERKSSFEDIVRSYERSV